jgi:hypothetical protein
MSEKPEALRLAGMLQAQADRHIAFIDDFRYQAATELRRQHAEIERLTADNERLREALREIADETYDTWTNGAKAQRIAESALKEAR